MEVKRSQLPTETRTQAVTVAERVSRGRALFLIPNWITKTKNGTKADVASTHALSFARLFDAKR